MRENKIKKIAVIGPECTGKSTLCSQLAVHYNTQWCPEFARGYLQKQGMKYSYENLLTIAKGQVAMEEEFIQRISDPQLAANNSKLLFIDTDMYVMKVWSEFVFGRCHQWILEQIIERKYDLYLLCNTDLPWVKDELREYPDLTTREKLFRIYKDILINQNTPWAMIGGDADSRLNNAINAVDTLLNK